jgi:hypothetical protein
MTKTLIAIAALILPLTPADACRHYAYWAYPQRQTCAAIAALHRPTIRYDSQHEYRTAAREADPMPPKLTPPPDPNALPPQDLILLRHAMVDKWVRGHGY